MAPVATEDPLDGTSEKRSVPPAAARQVEPGSDLAAFGVGGGAVPCAEARICASAAGAAACALCAGHSANALAATGGTRRRRDRRDDRRPRRSMRDVANSIVLAGSRIDRPQIRRRQILRAHNVRHQQKHDLVVRDLVVL